MTDPTKAFRRLSAAEALRALYIDFEGGKDQPPILLGVLRRPGRGSRAFVQQDVVDELFAGLGPAYMSLRGAVEKVVLRAEHGDRRIVSWSQHDLDVVRTLGADQADLVGRFERRYANALSVAKHWRNRLYGGDRPAEGRLAGYLEVIGYPVPEEAAAGEVGETIRVLRHRLERGLPVTAAQEDRWRRLVEHNRHDCNGMRRVCLKATMELDEAVHLMEGPRA
jgi:hypothetical protein